MLRRHGGTPRIWRTDRLATVIVPGSRDVQPSFAPVAKFYGVVVEPCPPRRGNRKGAVESSVRYVCGRWWRTMTAATPAQAQASLDVFCSGTADARRAQGRTASRRPSGRWPTPSRCSPCPPRRIRRRSSCPGRSARTRRWRSAATPTRCRPAWPAPRCECRHRLGTATLEIFSAAGARLASHRLAPDGAGTLVRSAGAPRRAGTGRAVGVHHRPAVRAQGQPPARRSQPAPRPPGCSPAWALR